MKTVDETGSRYVTFCRNERKIVIFEYLLIKDAKECK